MGTLLEHGAGFSEDSVEAAFWYGEAAKLGNVEAMHNLAIMHADGVGVERDLVEAARLFGSAAHRGLADSQYNLAFLYERGMGVTASLSEAYRWYLIVAAQGDSEAKDRAEAIKSQLPEDVAGQIEGEAREFTPETPDERANLLPGVATVLSED
jgi:localization factor PodJL